MVLRRRHLNLHPKNTQIKTYYATMKTLAALIYTQKTLKSKPFARILVVQDALIYTQKTLKSKL